MGSPTLQWAHSLSLSLSLCCCCCCRWPCPIMACHVACARQPPHTTHTFLTWGGCVVQAIEISAALPLFGVNLSHCHFQVCATPNRGGWVLGGHVHHVTHGTLHCANGCVCCGSWLCGTGLPWWGKCPVGSGPQPLVAPPCWLRSSCLAPVLERALASGCRRPSPPSPPRCASAHFHKAGPRAGSGSNLACVRGGVLSGCAAALAQFLVCAKWLNVSAQSLPTTPDCAFVAAGDVAVVGAVILGS